jgi:hypothetical protein
MKRITIIIGGTIVVIALLSMIAILLFGTRTRKLNPAYVGVNDWTDSKTVEYFGDGRFQIVDGRVGAVTRRGLWDCKSDVTIAADDVLTWREQDPFVYVRVNDYAQVYRGKMAWMRPVKYILIYLPPARVTRYKDISKVPLQHRSIFQSLG